ncbi:hypothetical protein BW730_14710 [Tessaracoccus aquimaris]|uniref:Nucleotidyltransferase n=1 Tax=Tessaracoccus aquimaris TaxID=1332264 RepID=A0A1Q2CR73_9ACTN|nr:hypothetical protein BW730_14710 [Tessaracoccus aquimaris]
MPLTPSLLAELEARFPNFLLIGAHARDYVVHSQGGLRVPRSTRDIDVSIGVVSHAEYAERTAGLEAICDTGMAFTICGVHVDVLPFGSIADQDTGHVLTGDGVITDVTGMAEAFTHANLVPIHGHLVRIPNLANLLILKTIAWRMRGDQTDKDASDLGWLMEASSHGSFEERLWSDEGVALLERFTPDEIGIYLAGGDAGRQSPSAARQCLPAIRGPELASALGRPRRARWWLDALAAGIADSLDESSDAPAGSS